jgi:hypothetical protein
MASATDIIKNFFVGAKTDVTVNPLGSPIQQQNDPKQDLVRVPMPQVIQRIRQDVSTWRDALRWAEMPYNPYRYKVQEMFIDTVLNAHVKACMEKRNKLTMLKEFGFFDKNENEIEDENLEALFNTRWFECFVKWALEAQAYGYSLISLGDVINNRFENITIVNRINISPDRRNVVAFKTSITGSSWETDEYKPWYIYVDTPTDIGVSRCGYGYLYPVALLEIFLRNLLGYNGDFTELFAQPYRVGKTDKTSEKEIQEFDMMLQNMGSAGWARISSMDEISMLESSLGGTGYKAYDNFEMRLERKVTKIILGHEDAMQSVPGKLGADQGGDDSPVARALAEASSVDSKMVERLVNEELIPRMKDKGFIIPDGVVFKYKNDREREIVRDKEIKTNTSIADLAVKMKNAGFEMTSEYFTEQTGIPAVKIAVIEPTESADPTPNIANRLKNIYK